MEHWLQLYWAVVPAGENYSITIEQAHKAIAARKLIRQFTQIREPGEKCTLTGEMQALYYSGDGSREAVRQNWTVIANTVRNPALVRDDERLGAIATIKRFAQDYVDDLSTGRFPSTSSIASATFRADVLKRWENMREVVERHWMALDELEIQPFKSPDNIPYLVELAKGCEDGLAYDFLSVDGDFFYEETFEPARLKEYLGKEPPPSAVRKAQRTLAALKRAVQDANLAPPHPYLGVLMMDGDRMGITLREKCR